MSFSAKLTLLICVVASFLSNCSFGENVAPRYSLEATKSLGVLTNSRLTFEAIEMPPLFPGSLAETFYEIAVKNILRDRDFAGDAYKQAIRLKPNYAEAHNGLGWLKHAGFICGNILPSKEDFEEAVSLHQKAISLKPNLFSAYDGLVKSFLSLHRRQEAVSAYHQMLMFQPETIDDHFDFASVCRRLDKDRQAILIYERLLALINNQLTISIRNEELKSSRAAIYLTQSTLYFKIGNRKKSEYYRRLWEAQRN